MDAAGLIDKTWYNDHACLRGTYVHKAVQLHHNGGVNFGKLDDEIKPYFDCYLDFLDIMKFKVIACEIMGYHSVYQYCGTADLIGRFPNSEDLSIIDIKTGAIPFWAAIQTQAYKLIFGQTRNISDRYGLQLKPKGKFSLKAFNNTRDYDVFMSCLTLYNFKKGLL
jgi:hypothetical protein